MAKTATVRARIEPELKSEAEEVLEQLGLTATEAIGLFYRQLALQRRLPLDVALPNATTLRTIRDTERGEGIVRCKNLDDLFKKLGI